MSTSLTLEADVLPMLAAFQAAEGYGTISIAFEKGIPMSVEIHQKMRLSQQIRNWLRPFTRRSPN